MHIRWPVALRFYRMKELELEAGIEPATPDLPCPCSAD